jgi:uncharacterized protein (TIGR03083 family)
MPRLDDLLAAYDAQLAELLSWLRVLPDAAAGQPSRLAGWTVLDLAHHTTEVPRALVAAVERPRPTDKPLSIAAYTAHWPQHADEIRDRERAGAVGATRAELVDRHVTAAADLRAAVAAAGDVVVHARRGPIKVSDLLATRVNELVVHSLDLSASVPELDPVVIDRQALGVSCRMLAGILAERAPGRTVELRIPPYSAIQCIEGPRHTRGTPPNVVEVDAVAWVELATGRLAWPVAISDGRLRASGERSDISAQLPVLS